MKVNLVNFQWVDLLQNHTDYHQEQCQVHRLCSNRAPSYYCGWLVLTSLHHEADCRIEFTLTRKIKSLFLSFFRNWKHMLIILIQIMNIKGKIFTSFPKKKERDKSERGRNLRGCYKNWNLYWDLKLQKLKDRSGNSYYSVNMVSISFEN